MSDLDPRLRRLGEQLDRDAPAITSDEARERAERAVLTFDDRRRPPWRPLLAIAAAIAAVLGAAVVLRSSDDPGQVVTTPARPGTTTTTVASTTSVPPTTIPGEVALPGERLEVAPFADAHLAVVGVAADDVLNVRAGPGTSFAVVFTLDPLATAQATGHNRAVAEAGVWSEVRVDGRTGWARSSFLLQPGDVDDITAQLFPAPAERPTAATMAALAQAVGDKVAPDDNEPPTRIVIVDGPSDGDVPDVTVDVLGFGDDSVGGQRLTVFAHRGPDGRFTVRSVESVLLCSRGVTDGMCV